MPWEITYEEDDEIVYTRLYGKVALTEYAKCCSEAFELSSERGARRFLTSLLEVESVLSISELTHIPELYAKVGFTKNDCAGFCIRTDKDRKENYAFFEKTVNDRGYNIRTFHELDDARLWLSCM